MDRVIRSKRGCRERGERRRRWSGRGEGKRCMSVGWVKKIVKSTKLILKQRRIGGSYGSKTVKVSATSKMLYRMTRQRETK